MAEFLKAPVDWSFLFKLKSLIHLLICSPIDIEIVQKVLEELPFLSEFDFNYLNQDFEIRICHSTNNSREFTVSFSAEEMIFSDLNAVVQWIREKGRIRKEIGWGLPSALN